MIWIPATRMLAIFGTCLILFVLASCQSRGNAAEMSPGEQAFKQNCQTCHRLPKTEGKSDAEWPALVDHYGQKAKLTQAQIDLITSWLLANN